MADRGLTEPQKRHLVEMIGPAGQTRFWRPMNAGEQACAAVLRKKGLLAGSAITHTDAYYLTDKGLMIAHELRDG